MYRKSGLQELRVDAGGCEWTQVRGVGLSIIGHSPNTPKGQQVGIKHSTSCTRHGGGYIYIYIYMFSMGFVMFFNENIGFPKVLQ